MMLYMKEHKLLFFLPWVFFLYNKIKKLKKKINEEKSVFIEEKESQLCQVHIIFTEGQFAAAERKRKERRDKMTHLLSVKATQHRLCETRITGRTILFCLLLQKAKQDGSAIAAILEEQTPSKCFYSVLLAAGWLTLSPLGTHISRISPFVLC